MNLSSPVVPLEVLAASFRTATHDTEAGLRAILRRFIRLKEGRATDEKPLAEVLSEGKEELLSLKRRLSERYEEQYSLYDNCKKRIHRHEELAADPLQKARFDFNAAILQYLHGRKELTKARLLARALNEQAMFELETDLLQRVAEVAEGILQNRLEPLEQWIHENHHNLDRSESTIYFELACCRFLTLLQADSLQACLQLRTAVQGLKLTANQQQTLQKLTYLLVDDTVAPKKLQEQLHVLEGSFKKAFFETYLVNFDSHLQRNLIVGFSSLKTICCCRPDTKNKEVCPICTQRVGQLAERVPMLTKDSSSLKCRINQSIMDEENYPIALPSGNIYSLTGLNATSDNDHYFCPNTDTWYPKAQAKKVFLA